MRNLTVRGAAPPCVRAAFLVLAAAAAALAVEPAEIDALLDRARAAPAEFAADALIRLAQTEHVARAKKAPLLEEAFTRAAGAQQPMKKRAVSAVRTGMAAFLDRAFAQDLDATGLQCRAVRALLAVDRRKARELFLSIPVPAPPKLTCDDPLVYDVSAYYETLAEVAKTSFSAAEIAADEPFQLLSSRLRGLQSPVQVAPVARLLASAALKPEQFESLAMAFATSLRDLAGDDRSFSYAVSREGGAGQQMAALAAACGKLGISAVPLIEGYRAFLARQFSAARCADSGERAPIAFGVQPNPEAELAGDPVRFFNERLRIDPVKPLAAEDIIPAKVEGAAGGLRSCDSQDCRRLVEIYRGLIIGPDGMPYGDNKKSGSEWQAKVKEYLAALAEWRQDSGSTASAHFQQKCALYSDLANVVPNGADRLAVLRGFLDFVKQNSFQRESRIEWFLPVNSLIGRVSLDPLGLGELMRELRGSQDPVISLYAALEDVAPRPPGARLGIF